MTSRRQTNSPIVVRTRTTPPSDRTNPRTAAPVSTRPPPASRRRRRVAATSEKRTTPEVGEWIAATPSAWGSISLRPARSSIRSPGTPFVSPRRSSPSSRPRSASFPATITLPESEYGTPCSSQKRSSSSTPAAAVARPERAGRIVDAGMDDAAVPAGLVAGDAGFLFENEDRPRGLVLLKPARHRQPDDPAADHHDVQGFRSVRSVHRPSGFMVSEGGGVAIPAALRTQDPGLFRHRPRPLRRPHWRRAQTIPAGPVRVRPCGV